MHERLLDLVTRNRMTRGAAGAMATGVLMLGAASCDGGDNVDNGEPKIATPTRFTLGVREIATATPTSTTLAPLTSTTSRSESPSPTATSARISPPVTNTPDSRLGSGENYAVQLSGPKTWVEVANKVDLQGLKAFTALAIVEVQGDPKRDPQALLAKGDEVEAYAVFISLPEACPDGDMAVAINSKAKCTGLKAPTNKRMLVVFTYDEGKIKAYADDGQSVELTHTERVPIEFGSLFIGLSPFGPKEGMNGKIDALGLLNVALTPDQVRQVQALIAGGGDISKIVVAPNNVIAVWPFPRENTFADATGKGHDGTVHGAVTLESVK